MSASRGLPKRHLPLPSLRGSKLLQNKRTRKGTDAGGSRILLLTIIIILSIAAVFLLSSCGQRGRSGSSVDGLPSTTEDSQKSASELPDEPPVTDENRVMLPEEEESASVEITPADPDDRVGEEPHKLVGTADGRTLVMELKQGPVDSGQIALTFDAGASSKPTPELLVVLAQKGVHATFFLTGKWVEQNKQLTREIVSAGHEIGNHTYSHPDLRNLSDDRIRQELGKTEAIIQDVAGVSTKPFFRPPYGGRDARVLQVASDEGYRCIYWTADSWDGFKKGIKADEIEKRVLDRAEPGAIVLMHCGSWPTVDALPRIIDKLRANGYELVKVSDLVGH